MAPPGLEGLLNALTRTVIEAAGWMRSWLTIWPRQVRPGGRTLLGERLSVGGGVKLTGLDQTTVRRLRQATPAVEEARLPRAAVEG